MCLLTVALLWINWKGATMVPLVSNTKRFSFYCASYGLLFTVTNCEHTNLTAAEQNAWCDNGRLVVKVSWLLHVVMCVSASSEWFTTAATFVCLFY